MRSRSANRLPAIVRAGEGLVGQCVVEKRRILLTEVPGDYLAIGSGLGSTEPISLIVMPVLFEGDVKAVIELASVRHFSETHLLFIEQLTESIGVILNTIAASMRTEELLKQSQVADDRAAEPANGAAAHQRRTRRESAPAARAQRRGRAANPGNRRGAAASSSARPSSCRSPRNTSRSFWPTCRTNCARRSTSLLILSKQLAENSEGRTCPQRK